jgi:putative peptidoglycan lipid II flippase
MPGFLWLIVADYSDTPGKFELAVELTRYTFPYLLFISLVAFLSGVLNSLTRFAIAAFAPALLNIVLIVAILVGPGGDTPAEVATTVRYMAIAVLLGGVAQFAMCWVAVRRAGIRLHFGRPRLTPAVKELVILILPATVAAGVYQISQLFYTFFASRLGEGALTNLFYADRLNQLPLSIIGTALGTAILPSISRAIERREEHDASDIQARAFDLAMLLTLPATLALSVTAYPIIAALFQGGNYGASDAAVTGQVLAILVLGLPAYVLVKVLTPGFYARKDVKTPVYIAMSILAGSIVANFALIPSLGIYSLPTVTSVGAWLNFALLFVILAVRGHFRLPGWLVSRIARQLVAAVLMGAVLFFLQRALGDIFTGGFGHRAIGLALIVGTGAVVYFGTAWVIGGIDRDDFKTLFRRARPEEAPLSEGQ